MKADSNALIKITGVHHHFGKTEVLQNTDLDIFSGEFVAIVGPSGCGKTTLLNLISGFIKPAGGTVECKGSMRMVYQQDGLFPWLTVSDNVMLGLRHIKKKKEKAQLLEETIALIGLEGFENHFPHQLSGGMRQRVELARALAGDSDILLMDEPFSALDYITRLRMRSELALLLQKRKRTVVLVTHDIEEAAQLADRVVVFSKRPGKILKIIDIDLPRPRPLTHESVNLAMGKLLNLLGLDTGPQNGNREQHSKVGRSL